MVNFPRSSVYTYIRCMFAFDIKHSEKEHSTFCRIKESKMLTGISWGNLIYV